MTKAKSFFNSLTNQQVIFALTLIGFFLATLSNYLQHDWINVDSLLYFESARLITVGKWNEAIAIYNWPFYSVLLATLSKLTGLGIQESAKIWNVIFFTITTFSLAKLIELSGGKKFTILAGGFLLFSSSYISGSALPMLLRDQGFWAFFLASNILLIRFYRVQSMMNGLAWQATAIIATLFRIEAVAYLVLLPNILIFDSHLKVAHKIAFFFKANTTLMIGAIILTTSLIFIPSIHLTDLARLQEPINLLQNIGHMLNTKASAMGALLGEDLDDYGLYATIISLLAIFIFKVLKLVGWPILTIFTLFKTQKQARIGLQSDAARILLYVLIISAINPLVSIFRSFVLSSRYIVSFTFIAIVFCAFCLSYLIKSSNKAIPQTSKFILTGTLIFLCVTFLHNFSAKKEGYHHEKDAVEFIKNNHIPVEKVFFTTPKSIYYAGLQYSRGCEGMWSCIEQSINNGSALSYEYLLIYIDIDKQFNEKKIFLSEKLVNYTLIKEFYGLNNKKVLMFYSQNRSSEKP